MFNTKGHEAISKRAILQRVSEFEIFRFYIPDLKHSNTPFCSELRTDSSPTCRVTILDGNTIYKDFGNGEGHTCFSYVMKKYSLTYYECLNVIATDLKLGLSANEIEKKAAPLRDIILGKEEVKKNTSIRVVKNKTCTDRDLAYWQQYNIGIDLLTKYKVWSISHYYVNTTLIKIPKDEIAFSYGFGDGKYKILRPQLKEYKWTNNAGGVVQGLKQLPASGNILYITSSLKDVMSLRSLDKLAVAPQSENTVIDKQLIKRFKEKFDRVIIYYNNDQPGIDAATAHSEIYGVECIHHGRHTEKDPSDFIKEHGVEKYKQLLKDLTYGSK